MARAFYEENTLSRGVVPKAETGGSSPSVRTIYEEKVTITVAFFISV